MQPVFLPGHAKQNHRDASKGGSSEFSAAPATMGNKSRNFSGSFTHDNNGNQGAIKDNNGIERDGGNHGERFEGGIKMMDSVKE
jgi:hypothetical protein